MTGSCSHTAIFLYFSKLFWVFALQRGEKSNQCLCVSVFGFFYVPVCFCFFVFGGYFWLIFLDLLQIQSCVIFRSKTAIRSEVLLISHWESILQCLFFFFWFNFCFVYLFLFIFSYLAADMRCVAVYFFLNIYIGLTTFISFFSY